MATVGLLLLLDLSVSAGIVFVTVWFFFVQSPFLFNRLGRQKFVPIMMQITQLYFDFVVILNMAVLLLSFLRVSTLEKQNIAAGVSSLAVLFNTFFLVPRALARGRATMRERVEKDDSSSVKDFAVEGGSKTGTKTMHQLVVLFVLIMVGALVVHMFLAC
mmetsp:Transcript_16436/g.47206  ORF Transcript_16436/g.47206 Transcript_16436/m.47206 type:complete len:160 (-) Transcript_16436:1740-2219(-)